MPLIIFGIGRDLMWGDRENVKSIFFFELGFFIFLMFGEGIFDIFDIFDGIALLCLLLYLGSIGI